MAITPRSKTNGTGMQKLEPGEGRFVTEYGGATVFSKTVTQAELVKLVKGLQATILGWKTGRHCILIDCEYVKAPAKKPATPKKAPARTSRAAMH